MIRRYLTVCLLSLSCAAAGQAQPLQGYVSGNLLRAWCEGKTPLDVEACLSYLRGVFDTVQVMQSRPVKDDPSADSSAICIPKQVPVTQLRSVSRDYTGEHPGALSGQAAAIILDAFLEAFPCKPGG